MPCLLGRGGGMEWTVDNMQLMKGQDVISNKNGFS
jgi:hypothetical protein